MLNTLRNSKISLLVIGVMFFAFSPNAFAVSTYNGVDPNVAAPISVGRCVAANSLDCIVGVNIIRSDGSVLNGVSEDKPCLIPPAPQGTMGRAKQQCQPPFDQGSWSFKMRDGSEQGMWVGDSFATPTWHQTPSTALSGLGINISPSPFLRENDQVEIQMRTSWLIPTGVTAYGRNVFISNEEIVGGHLLTLRASVALVAKMLQGAKLYEMEKDSSTFSADRVDRQISFNVGDVTAAVGINSQQKSCFNGKNFPWVSSNIQSAATPSVNRDGNIVIPISAPHFLVDHTSLNSGYYEADVPVGADACAFRDSSLIGAQSYSVSVIDQNGTPEVTTNAISVDSNHVAHFRISGIHFSQPIINIKGVKKSLTCFAANKIKVIEGANPVCPKGFIPKK